MLRNNTDTTLAVWRLFGLLIAGMLLAQLGGSWILKAVYGEEALGSLKELGTRHPAAWIWIRGIQVAHAVFSMLLPALIINKSVTGKWWPAHDPGEQSPWMPLVMIPVMLFSFMPLMQTLYVFNQQLRFPGIMQDILMKMEIEMNGMVEGMLADMSVPAIMANVFIIVILAAVCEELFFRGVLQRLLARKIDIHIAIFISAFAFSTIHMQFFGFLPRLALGVLFGYIYMRTNRMTAPIFAHATFNAVQLASYYYAKSIGQGTGQDAFLMPVSFTVSFTFMFLMLYFIFHTYTSKNKPA